MEQQNENAHENEQVPPSSNWSAVKVLNWFNLIDGKYLSWNI